MKTFTRPSVLAAVVAAVSVFAPIAAAASPGGDADIRALEARFAKAVAAKDLDGVMAVYAPDVLVFDVAPPRQYAGAAAYREDWKGIFGVFSGPVNFQITDLVVASDVAMGYSHSIQRLWGPGGNGHPFDLTVRVSDVYRKTAGGWRIVHEHVSIPVDLATGKGDMASKP